MHNYHLCNFWFCFYERQNNKTYVMFFFWLQWDCCISLHFTSSSTAAVWLQLTATVLTALSYPVVSLVILAPECNMAQHFGCIPKLLCGSALHLTLYWWSLCGLSQTSGQIYLVSCLSFTKNKQLRKSTWEEHMVHWNTTDLIIVWMDLRVCTSKPIIGYIATKFDSMGQGRFIWRGEGRRWQHKIHNRCGGTNHKTCKLQTNWAYLPSLTLS